MTYGITRILAGKQPILEIEEQDYHAIAAARESMYNALYVQEKFVYLIENPRELEIELLASTVRGMNFPDISWDQMIGTIHLFVRRVANLLSTVRLYIDHVKQDLKRTGNCGEELTKEFELRLSGEYDDSFEFRLCEALRNYIQHCGIPIRGIYRNSHVTDRASEPGGIVHYVEITLDKDRLSVDAKLKSLVREELAAVEGCVDLRPALREYVCRIAKVHEWLQEELAGVMHSSVEILRNAVERFHNHAGTSDDSAISLVHEEQGQRKAQLHLDTAAKDRFLRLIREYDRVSKLGMHFVSSVQF